MATTGLPRPIAKDLSRVVETLDMLSPRWSVWTLMTLGEQPLRYSDIKTRLPMLFDAQLSARLVRLTADGLVERHEETARHVTYQLSGRGRSLGTVIATLATYGDTHLDKIQKPNRATGELEPERIPAAQNAEDALSLITPKYATPLLWALRHQGSASGRKLADVVLDPSSTTVPIYKPLRQLVEDGLVDRLAHSSYQLSSQGEALTGAFQALSSWASGRAKSTSHPLWPSAADRPAMWAANSSPSPRPQSVVAAPESAVQRPPIDLFSHGSPARPATAASMGGRAR
ncbi:winged helix-turn-helix transcriptional regulator [Streptomyces sp. H27-H1]|uniref:winged helix-turn-helix transcriptional regulator n=1 Tax=Streptomyces sp. H27-H1 TaxID=2996461 RepID=UPI00226FA90D|nr:winged helix-turn-helix transcriptional regulator [Streptomyces sp. H27-H1]MCY0931527.1 winged helix-turn-helix transcriptional regulator [Streptomyces sp. H27-H1]